MVLILNFDMSIIVILMNPGGKQKINKSVGVYYLGKFSFTVCIT